MGNYYIHVGSITNAMRGKKLLEKVGIRSFMHRTSQPGKEDGCGYRLLVTEDVVRAEQILRNRGIRVIRVSEAM